MVSFLTIFTCQNLFSSVVFQDVLPVFLLHGLYVPSMVSQEVPDMLMRLWHGRMSMFPSPHHLSSLDSQGWSCVGFASVWTRHLFPVTNWSFGSDYNVLMVINLEATYSHKNTFGSFSFVTFECIHFVGAWICRVWVKLCSMHQRTTDLILFGYIWQCHW